MTPVAEELGMAKDSAGAGLGFSHDMYSCILDTRDTPIVVSDHWATQQAAGCVQPQAANLLRSRFQRCARASNGSHGSRQRPAGQTRETTCIAGSDDTTRLRRWRSVRRNL